MECVLQEVATSLPKLTVDVAVLKLFAPFLLPTAGCALIDSKNVGHGVFSLLFCGSPLATYLLTLHESIKHRDFACSHS